MKKSCATSYAEFEHVALHEGDTLSLRNSSVGVITTPAHTPEHISMDNGPELISQRLESWAKDHHIELLHIQPGKPAQNAYIERFNHTCREEVLDSYLFDALEEVRLITESWLEDYNAIRPHEALKGISPRQFALQQA